MKPTREGSKYRIETSKGAWIIRPNKLAVHYTCTIRRGSKNGKERKDNDDLLRLSIYGTLDSLASRSGLVTKIAKPIMVEHPVDKGYFKQMWVISEYGKRLLKQHCR